MNVFRLVLLLLSLLLLTGCASKVHKESAVEGRSFSIRDLMKSDVDIVTEVQQRQVISALRQLGDKALSAQSQGADQRGGDFP